MQLITESKALSTYKISKKKLRNQLSCVTRSTDRYGDGVPLRLYQKDDVQSLIAAAKSKKKQESEDVRRRVQAFVPAKPAASATGNVKVPIDIWQLVISQLRFEPELTWDSRCCVSDMYPRERLKAKCRDRVNLALTCRDLYVCVSHSWSQFAEQLPQCWWEIGWPYHVDLAEILKDPNHFSVSYLRQAVVRFRLTIHSTKPELIMCLFCMFGLDAPTLIPARLLSQVKRQHGYHHDERLNCMCDNCMYWEDYRIGMG